LARTRVEIGWILHRDHWRKGYGTELGRALIASGFGELHLHRIVARCDAENCASFGVMEKLNMRREGCFLETRMAHKLSDKPYGDELLYAILREEWEIQKEIAYYDALPCRFFRLYRAARADRRGKFISSARKNSPADPERKYVPAYHFAICRGGEKIGNIGLRIGYTEGLYYGGQIGYNVDEAYRGHGYAAEACRLIFPVARAHGMEKLLITNEQSNVASRRVCEKLGARFVRLVRLPEQSELYQKGLRYVNIFEVDVPKE